MAMPEPRGRAGRRRGRAGTWGGGAGVCVRAGARLCGWLDRRARLRGRVDVRAYVSISTRVHVRHACMRVYVCTCVLVPHLATPRLGPLAPYRLPHPSVLPVRPLAAPRPAARHGAACRRERVPPTLPAHAVPPSGSGPGPAAAAALPTCRGGGSRAPLGAGPGTARVGAGQTRGRGDAGKGNALRAPCGALPIVRRLLSFIFPMNDSCRGGFVSRSFHQKLH